MPVRVLDLYDIIKGKVFTAASCVLFNSSEILDERKFCRSQNFLEVLCRSSLVWWGWGGGISSCLLYPHIQESAEQEQRLGNEGPLPH